MRRGIALTLGIALGVSLDAATTAAESPRIRVGPNILVSRDGDVPHCESMIAANPKDPKNLLGAATTFTRPPHGGLMNKTYASTDGGYTWTDSTLPIEVQSGGGDPQVGFGIQGTALFVGIGSYGMAVHRSEDGGKTWNKPAVLPFADHEQLVVDHTLGRFAGRIYLAGETAKEPGTKSRQSRVVLFRSEDDGQSFIGPVEVAQHKGGGLAVSNLEVLSDGAVVVNMIRYPDSSNDKTTPVFDLLYSISSDGGASFSSPRRIAEQHFGGYAAYFRRDNAGRIDENTVAVFAAGRGDARFRDRLYATWPDFRDADAPRILFSYSADRGRSWSVPRPVDPPAPGSSQFQQALATAEDGTVGVMWYDTRGFPDKDRYHVYFTASLDGGKSFLPSVRVSSEPSVPMGAGNLRPFSAGWKREGPLTSLDLASGFGIWPNGGHYMGLTADVEGTFHPFWADSRDGTFQLYTARIRVGTENQQSREQPKVASSLKDKVAVYFDPFRYLPDGREVLMPVRLRNESKETVYGPLRVEIKELVDPWLVKTGLDRQVEPPMILNAANGKEGVGAVFDYSRALGDFDSLEPGALTEALTWRVRLRALASTSIHFGVEITGSIEKKAKP